MGTFVIAKYHCEVAGETTDSVDYQVRYFDKASPEEVMSRLEGERPHEYENCDGETVRWLFDETMAIEVDPTFKDGEEIIGFITGTPTEIEDTEPSDAADAHKRRR